MKKYFLALITFLALAECKKNEVPIGVNGTPIFEFDGTIGTDSIHYQAGVNGVYMYTSFFKDIQNLMTLKSSFAQKTCEECDPYLSFEVKDIDTTSKAGLSNGITDVLGNSVFYSYSLDSIITTLTTETFQFTANQSQGTHSWNFGDGSAIETTANPTHTFIGSGLKTITHVNIINGIIDSISNTFNIDVSSPCRPQFQINFDSTTNLAIVTSNGSAFNTITWDFGNGGTGSGVQDSNTYNNPGNYLITMSAINPTCGTMVYKKRLNTTNQSQASGSFDYSTIINTMNESVPRLNKSAFIITWKANDKVYKSYKSQSKANQSGNPIFEVTSVSNYENNEKGNKTIKLNGKVNTYLYNQASPFDSIKIVSKNLVLAAAYP